MPGSANPQVPNGGARRIGVSGTLVAADVMSTPAATIRLQDSLATAWDVMRRHRVRHLVVVDDDHAVAILDGYTVAARWPAGGPELPYRRPVRELIRRGVHCVHADTPVQVVAQVMRLTRSDAVPVVTAAGQLAGLITSTDLVAVVANEAQTGHPGCPDRTLTERRGPLSRSTAAGSGAGGTGESRRRASEVRHGWAGRGRVG